ncbi:MAG: carboxyl transferase domain-containing protein, partial [Flavobacteriales bacterium]
DAVRTGVGKSLGKEVVICCMDFAFIGGSMGSVVGEKIARGIDYSIKKKLPFVMISKSGGARMMEAALSLMQLAKTSAKLAQLAEAGLPYISLCTDPTTGGTTADFQTAEFLKEHGFLDFIVHRRDLKRKINQYIDLIQNNPIRKQA